MNEMNDEDQQIAAMAIRVSRLERALTMVLDALEREPGRFDTISELDLRKARRELTPPG